jgi:hypothetical protein
MKNIFSFSCDSSLNKIQNKTKKEGMMRKIEGLVVLAILYVPLMLSGGDNPAQPITTVPAHSLGPQNWVLSLLSQHRQTTHRRR